MSVTSKVIALNYYTQTKNVYPLREKVKEGKLSLNEYKEVTNDSWEDVDIEILKRAKKLELYLAMKEEMSSFFTSSATGEEHLYGYSLEDQKNIGEQLNAFVVEKEAYGNIQTILVPWNTLDAGWIDLPLVDFFKVLDDGKQYVNSFWVKYRAKTTEVDGITSIEEYNEIKWNDEDETV